MKIEHIINETTTAGAVSSVAMPLGKTVKRTNETVKGLIPAEKVMKAKKKGPYANSLSEGKNRVSEAELQEDDLIIVPGQGMKRKNGFIPQGKSRVDHEVEMAKSDLLAIFKNTKSVMNCIKDKTEDEGLEGWVQEKIIKASDYMNTIAEYLEGKRLKEMSGGVIAAGGVGESAVEEGDLHSDFDDVVQKVKRDWEERRARERQAMSPRTVSEPSREELEARLRELESEFDPEYQYSDDYSFWTKQNAIAREIASIKKKLGSQGVAEANEQKYRVTYDMYFTNREKPLYTKTRTVRAGSEEKAIKIIQDLIGGRNHRIEKDVAEGWKEKAASAALAGSLALGSPAATADIGASVASGLGRGAVAGVVGPQIYKEKNAADLAFAEKIPDETDKAEYLKAFERIKKFRTLSTTSPAGIGANAFYERRFEKLKQNLEKKYNIQMPANEGVAEAKDPSAKIAALEKKIDAKQGSLEIAREKRKMSGKSKGVQSEREVKLGAEISKLHQELHILKNNKQGVAEGWKERAAGATIGAAAIGGIGAAINASPPTYVDGIRYNMSFKVPDNAQLTTDDKGRKVYIWTKKSTGIKSGGQRTHRLYHPAEQVKEQGVAEGTLTEKAKSTAQQKFFGMAHAMQKGKKIPGASKELKDVAKSMSKSDVKDFAKTKHKDLPAHVKKEK
jgi:hypothetical protein